MPQSIPGELPDSATLPQPEGVWSLEADTIWLSFTKEKQTSKGMKP